jgi:xanthine/uracil permease
MAFIFAIVCVAVMAVANRLLQGVWKSMVVILAMILGALTYYCLTSFPSQLATDTKPAQILLGSAQFDTGVVIAFCFCYIALLINEIGSVQSLGEFIEADKMERRQSRGMLITGVMNVVSGACGVPGPVD